MSQILADKRNRANSSSTNSIVQQAVWMLSVDGETFVVFSRAEKDHPIKTLGRLRGRRHFSSEKQATLIREWYKTLSSEQVPITAKSDLPLVEISDLDLIALSKTGLASREMMALGERLELSGKEIAKLLTLSQRTFHRRKPEELLDQVASERLLMLTKLADHGFEVFEDQGKFNRWLRRPLRILSNQAPLDILDTSQGIKMVDTILGRIEYGVYS